MVKASAPKYGDHADGEDVRIERTRTRLFDAVLQMAREGDITTASVAELTRRAGINRGTFYAHAESPVQLLTKVLSQELDALRQQTAARIESEGLLLRDLSHETLEQIVDHVVRHEAVYDSPDRSSSMYALRVVLAEHVEQSVLSVLEGGYAMSPLGSKAAIAMQAAFLAHGVAAAVEVWLRLPKPRDRSQLSKAVESMYPSWYAPAAR
jgi:AcrR family transcriptional regulator